MSTANFQETHPQEHSSQAVGAGRRDRQRRRRAAIVARSRQGVPWLAVVQLTLALAMVVIASIAMDWRQPLELVIVAIVFAMCSTAAFLLLRRTNQRSHPGIHLLSGPLSCGLCVALLAAVMWGLKQFPETDAYTSRHVMEVQAESDALLHMQDVDGAANRLRLAIEQTDSAYWKQRWTAQLHALPISPVPAAPAATEKGYEPLRELAPPTISGERDKSDTEGASKTNAAAESGDGSKSSPSVLQHLVELQATQGYAAGELYLRTLIRQQPRSTWQGDYQQWYVDHWIDWGNAHTDLDQRHVCYLRALRAARGFDIDDSVVSSMLVRLEEEIERLPSLLPTGSRASIESVDVSDAGVEVQLSVLSPRHEFLSGLTSKDVRLFRGDTELNQFALSGGHRFTRPTQQSFVVLVDQSDSDTGMARSRMEAANRFCRQLPSSTAIQLMSYSDELESSDWMNHQTVSPATLSGPVTPAFAPVLRPAIRQALGALSAREGTRELVIVSAGREDASTYVTATSLLQAASRANVRIHATAPDASTSSVKQLLADLSAGSGGQFLPIAPDRPHEVWDQLQRRFPKGNYILSVPVQQPQAAKFRLVIGRGATLCRLDFQTPPRR